KRSALAQNASNEAIQAMQVKFNELKGSYAMTLPWMTVGTPQVASAQTGKVNGLACNTLELQGFTDLVAKEKSDVVTGQPVNLYQAEHDAQLDDKPIHFRFSPLAAPVVNNIAPARAILPETFTPMGNIDYAACATK